MKKNGSGHKSIMSSVALILDGRAQLKKQGLGSTCLQAKRLVAILHVGMTLIVSHGEDKYDIDCSS